MTDIRIVAGPFVFAARFERIAAPQTCAWFERLLPYRERIIHVRWSGEACWIPLGGLDPGIGHENATSYPAPGQILFYPSGISETEILLAYGASRFASKAGQLAGNPFLTIVEGLENLRPLGELTLWHGAQRSNSRRSDEQRQSDIMGSTVLRRSRHDDDVPLCAPRRADRVEVRRQDRGVLSPGNTTTAATALLELYEKGKQQQWDASERLDWSLELDPENPMHARRRIDLDLRDRYWNRMTDKEQRLAAPPPAGLADLAVHARRAGRADRHRQDRPDRARHRRQVLCRDPGDGRGAPRRGLQAAAAREVRARLSDHPRRSRRCSKTCSPTAAGT